MRRGVMRRALTTTAIAATCLLAVALLLNACGVSTAPTNLGRSVALPTASGAAGTATAASARATATRATVATHTPVPGGMIFAASGCVAGTSSGAFAPASVMLSSRNGGAATVKVGQTVGIDLSMTYRWNARLDDPSHALTPINPQGALNTANNTCAWRFLATGAGQVTLTFTGIFQCQPPRMCPAVALDFAYTVNVQR